MPEPAHPRERIARVLYEADPAATIWEPARYLAMADALLAAPEGVCECYCAENGRHPGCQCVCHAEVADGLRAQLATVTAAKEAAETRSAALEAGLARIEWITDASAPGFGFCGACEEEQGDGHKETCWLAALLTPAAPRVADGA